jgi:L-alanine-DL-glutamate epimerase-like enolase superfamily enzyme
LSDLQYVWPKELVCVRKGIFLKIRALNVSVFELPANTGRFQMEEVGQGARRRWVRRSAGQTTEQVHVLHVKTDEGIEGVCTVGDARYTTMRAEDLEQLRLLVVGEDPLERERLYQKLQAATRGMFTRPGWFGAFDNCLWDILGKATGQPVHGLLGRVRGHCSAYYNFNSSDKETAVVDAKKAVAQGFIAVKDHFNGDADENIACFHAVRDAVGDDVDILHDAAGCTYSFHDAVRIGKALEYLRFGWFEEPLADRDQVHLQKLCDALAIPILAPETLMHDVDLSAQWLITGATDLVRANGRLGTTGVLKLAHLAELHHTLIEFNGPGGLFGLVHAHLVCAISNTTYYEYFPNGSRDARGREIGLLNPPLPENGQITPPYNPGWGAEWDWAFFKKKRVGEF